MATLAIKINEDYVVDVTIRESDIYTEKVYIEIVGFTNAHAEREYHVPENKNDVNELLLTPSQLDLLGRFLIREAETIRLAQEARKNLLSQALTN